MMPFRIAGHLVFLTLGVLSIYYAAERVCYTDAAWQFFLRVNDEGFLFPMGRYGVAISEIPLFLAVKAGLPFNALIYLFSFSYIALYYLAWRLCTYTFNNQAAGIALLLSLTLGWKHGFLHTVTETHQAMVFAILFYAFIDSHESLRNWWKYIVGTLLAFATYLCHPVGLFMICFASGYYAVSRKKIAQFEPYIYVGCCLLPSLFSFFVKTHGYDDQFYTELKKVGELIPKFFTLYPVQFLESRFGLYWLPLFVSLLALALYYFNRLYLRMATFIISILVYVVIACIAFNQGDSDMMMEKTFLPAIFMLSIAFADQLIHFGRISLTRKSILIALLCFAGIKYIIEGCKYYEQRVSFIRKMVEKTGIPDCDKFYFKRSDQHNELMLAPWGFGTETLVLSKFYYTKQISIYSSWEGDSAYKDNTLFMGATFEPKHVSQLNPRYFSLNNNPYQPINNP
ncbi:MAG: hypothetical protein EXR21_04105 [Flavobacteriaceae bacterium]|nr:hypothetical protein [Flavobacteriaceae bacterium]